MAQSYPRHCERSEAIRFVAQSKKLDCFVASLLATTIAENAGMRLLFRRILRRRRVFLLRILSRLLLRRLQIVDGLLQADDRALQAVDLAVGGIELLLMDRRRVW